MGRDKVKQHLRHMVIKADHDLKCQRKTEERKRMEVRGERHSQYKDQIIKLKRSKGQEKDTEEKNAL